VFKELLDGSKRLIGMTTGAAVMFGFGIVWLLLGLFRGRRSPRLQASRWVTISLLVAGIVLGGAIADLGLRASRRAVNPIPLSRQQVATDREIARHFYLIFGAELAAIALAVVVLNVIHQPGYILSGIALIVGVHFFPLAALFRAPLYYATGALGCAIGVAGFLVADTGFRQKFVGLSFGLLLWMTALWIVWTGLAAAPSVAQNVRMM
jgi:hypothetical protein